MKRLGIGLILLCQLMLCSSCEMAFREVATLQSVENSFFAMDTYMTMFVYGNEETNVLLKEAEQLIRQLEDRISVTKQNSDIYAVNHSGGRQIAISPTTEELLLFALDMAKNTNGLLEPTIYPILTAWGFTVDHYNVPDQQEIDRLLANVSYTNIRVTNEAVMVLEGVQIDLGAVAKGYAGDKVADLLRAHGITSALINLGGNVQTIGMKPDGKPWRIGVRNPFSNGNIGVLEVEDRAVVTSGGYERYFVDENGNTYGHILDPRTGYPAQSGLVSTTVVATDGRRCDALSTALYIMGVEEATKYWQRHPGDFEMLLITDANEIYLTEGLENRFSLGQNAANQKVIVMRK